jgi:hypothetical protein
MIHWYICNSGTLTTAWIITLFLLKKKKNYCTFRMCNNWIYLSNLLKLMLKKREKQPTWVANLSEYIYIYIYIWNIKTVVDIERFIYRIIMQGSRIYMQRRESRFQLKYYERKSKHSFLSGRLALRILQNQ